MPAITPPTPLKEQAYQAILDRLLTGQYAPGDQLDRRRTAADLDMSPAPVHEAMIRLECEGLLVTLPRRGTQVRPVSRQDVWSYYVLRESLECQAARLLATQRRANALKTLLPLAQQVDKPARNTAKRFRNEIDFHRAVVSLAGCAALAKTYAMVMNQGAFYRASLLLPEAGDKPFASHVDLLDAMATTSATKAEQAARNHIWAGKPKWLSTFNPHNAE